MVTKEEIADLIYLHTSNTKPSDRQQAAKSIQELLESGLSAAERTHKQVEGEKSLLEQELYKVVEYTGAKVGYDLNSDMFAENPQDTIGDACIRKIKALTPDTEALETILADCIIKVGNGDLTNGRIRFHICKFLRTSLQQYVEEVRKP